MTFNLFILRLIFFNENTHFKHNFSVTLHFICTYPMKHLNIFTLCLCMAGIFASLNSCVKKHFDAPPDNSSYDPMIPVTATIAELQQQPEGVALPDSLIVSGIVVMDDRSGNYYKSIVIQDESGGIPILLDQNNLYNDYPVGRKIYVRCGGLFLGRYGQNLQLGYSPDASGNVSAIPLLLMEKHIVKANFPNPVIPDTLSLQVLSKPDNAAVYLNTLVVIKNAEFSSDELGGSYAQPASLASATTRTIRDCSGGNILLRTSGYAKFQPEKIPEGNGLISGIYTRYNQTPQLVIRDTSDVRFYNSRCPEPSLIFSDGFSNLDKWNAVNITGDQVWHTENFGNPQPCAVMKGYENGNHENEDWLITLQAVDLSGYATVRFSVDYAGKYNGDPLRCLISTDYSGSGDPRNASWTELAVLHQNNFEFTAADIDISAYRQEQVFIAFQYTSSDSSGATWEVDNVKIWGE